MKPTKLYSLAEITRLTGLSRKQLKSLIGEGRLGFITINRRKYLPEAELDNFFTQNLIRLEPKKSIHNDVDLAQMRKEKKTTSEFNSSSYFEQLRRNPNGLDIQKR